MITHQTDVSIKFFRATPVCGLGLLSTLKSKTDISLEVLAKLLVSGAVGSSASQIISIRKDQTDDSVSVFSPEDVGHEQDEAGRQACDDKLVDGEDVLQSVYPLLHGAGVEVVVDPSSNAPQRPHSIHHERHTEARGLSCRPPYGLQGRQQIDLLMFNKSNNFILGSRKGLICCPGLNQINEHTLELTQSFQLFSLLLFSRTE